MAVLEQAKAISMKPRRKFQNETTEDLRTRIDHMEGILISDAWSERFGKRVPNRRLNRAYMTGRAVLADREGDFNEGKRLRETLEGLEERLDQEERAGWERVRQSGPAGKIVTDYVEFMQRFRF